MKQEKANQHFVPESFLKGFTIESKKSLIWGYNKKHPKHPKRTSSTNRICSKKFYYEQPLEDGQKTQILEDGFEKIESHAIQIIRELPSKRILKGEDKGCLSFYLGLLLTRGPAFRDGCHEYHKHSVDIITQREFEAGRLPKMPDILKKELKDNDITSVLKTQILPHVSLGYVISMAQGIGESLCNKKWDIYLIEDDKFYITSDNPIMFGFSRDKNKDVGPAHPDSMVICPVTKKMAIIIRPYCSCDSGPYELKLADKKGVDIINKTMCFNAMRFVYSPQKTDQLLKEVIDAKDWSLKFRVYRFGDAIITKWGVHDDSLGVIELTG
jgi:hypothetical protein